MSIPTKQEKMRWAAEPARHVPLFRGLAIPGLVLSLGLAHGLTYAQQAGGRAIVSVTLPPSLLVVTGWSVKQGLLGRPLVDDRDKQIGTVIDLVVTVGAAPYILIIGVGGHLDVRGHAVALPRDAVVERDGLLHLPGASYASLQALPKFTYEPAPQGGLLSR